MRLKFFRAGGHDELLQLEHEVNRWLKNENPKIEKVETNLCSVGTPNSDVYQYALVSIRYEA